MPNDKIQLQYALLPAILAMQQMIFDLKSNIPPIFSIFLGDANRALIDALQRNEDNLFYLWGNKGVGKSYLSQAWLHSAQQAGLRTCLIPNGQSLDIEDETHYDAIALMDIQNYNAAEQAALFTLFNHWRDSNSKILFTATAPPLALSFREDIRTRLGLSLIYAVKPLQDEEKIHVLQALAQSRQMYVNEDVYRYLLRHGTRNLDLLIYIISHLDDYAVAHGRKMTIPLLKSFLQETHHEQLSHF